MKNKLILVWSIIFLLVIQVTQLEGAENDSEKIRVARLFGEGHGPECKLGVAADGDMRMLDEVSKIQLRNVGLGYKVYSVRLEDMVPLINRLMPADSEWKVKVDKNASNIEVSGHMGKNMMETLVGLMQGGGLYCRVTKGLIEFRTSEDRKVPDNEQVRAPGKDEKLSTQGSGQQKVDKLTNTDKLKEGKLPIHNSIRVKPESILTREDMAKGSAEYWGVSPAPMRMRKNPDEGVYSGNTMLMCLLKEEVVLNIANDIELKDVSLVKLAAVMNSKIPAASKWEIVVNEDAKQLRVSGSLGKDLLMSLGSFMRHRENFHCRVTDGVVEFKKGVNSWGIVPLEDSPIMQAKDSPHVEEETITQTIEKCNAKCNFNIADAMALDLIKLFEARAVEVDISEVKDVIKKRDITVTVKTVRWIDIITNISDQIGADILISPGKIKLVPHKDITQKK